MFKNNKTKKTTINKLKKILAGVLAVGSMAATSTGSGCNYGQGFRGGNFGQSAGGDIECLFDPYSPQCW